VTPLEIALTLHRCGIVAFPLGRETKKPLVKWEPLQWAAERPHEDDVRRLFAGFPDCNVAMLAGETSRLWFVDADSAEAFEAIRRNWPNAPWVTRTSRGGHFRFAVPESVNIRALRNMVHIRLELPDGTSAEIDTRGQGGYVVAPGSVHPSGRVYESEGWPWSATDRARLPVFDPEWSFTTKHGEARTFAQEIEEHERRERGYEARAAQKAPEITPYDLAGGAPIDCARRYLRACPGAVEGSGGDTYTYSIACRAVLGFALSDAEALSVLAEWNQTCCPPWTDRDLQAKIRNARQYGRERVGGRLERIALAYTPLATAAPAEALPPSVDATDAEAAVLGAMLSDPEAGWAAGQYLTPERFGRGENVAVYRAASWLLANGSPVQTQSVVERLRQTGALESAGGPEYVAALTDHAVSGAAVEHYAKIVAGKAQMRDLRAVARKIDAEIRTGTGTPEEIVDRCSGWFMKATESGRRDEATFIADGLRDEVERINRNEDAPGLLTHLVGIDQILGGLKPEELYILAARPSMGKSSLALTIAREIAVRDNFCVGIFSLEMSKRQVERNLLGQFAAVSPSRMAESSKLTQRERDTLNARWRDLAQYPILVDASSDLSVMQLRASARRMKAGHNAALVIVDYLQLLRGDGENRAEEVSEIAKGLKRLARELQIPVLALAQLNRGVESRDGNKPRLSDLKESGGIEEAADGVLMLWREGYYKRDKPDLARKAEVIVAKNRNGPTSATPLTWEYEYMRFTNA